MRPLVAGSYPTVLYSQRYFTPNNTVLSYRCSYGSSRLQDTSTDTELQTQEFNLSCFWWLFKAVWLLHGLPLRTISLPDKLMPLIMPSAALNAVTG